MSTIDKIEEEYIKLKEFGLSTNQAKLLWFFIKQKPESKISFKKINQKLKTKPYRKLFKKDIHWDLLNSLLKQGFITVGEQVKPWVYQYNQERLKEILQKERKINSNIQMKLEQIIEILNKNDRDKNIDINQILSFLQLSQGHNSVNNEQLLIMKTLYSNKNGKLSPCSLSINQIAEKIDGININKIRYNLKNLEKIGFIQSFKRGRNKIFRPFDLVNILKKEKDEHKKYWEQKQGQMSDIIQYFYKISRNRDVSEQKYKEDVLSNQKLPIQKSIHQTFEKLVQTYELIDFDEDTMDLIDIFMKNSKKELILDFRISIKIIDTKTTIVESFFNRLISFLKNHPKIRVKIIAYLEGWLTTKLEPIYIQLIQLISEANFEFRIPIETNDENKGENTNKIFRVITDNTLIDLIVKKSLDNIDKIWINWNELSVEQARREFNNAWERSIDVRDALLEYSLSNELSNVLLASVTKKAPEYFFKIQGLSLTGYKKIHNIILNMYKRAKSEILTLTGTISFSKDKNLELIDEEYQRAFFNNFFETIIDHCKAGINIRLLRNNLENDLLTEINKERIKRAIELLVLFFPYLQIRQVDMPQYHFTIIDRKILMLHKFLERGQIRLTFFSDEFIINKFLALFENAWTKSFDIRMGWLSEKKSPVQQFLKKSLKKLSFQITLPKTGEIKVFDGKFTKHIIRHLLRVSKDEIFVFQSFSDLYYKSRGKNISDELFKLSFQVLSYGWEVITAVITKKLKANIIVTYLPEYVSAITYKNLKLTIDLFPKYQVRFLPPGLQTNIIYSIFDNYVNLVIGDLRSDNFQFLIINDVNLKSFYKAQFINFWNNSIELRQIFKEYGSKRKKKLVIDSINKYRLYREYHPMEVRKIFPRI